MNQKGGTLLILLFAVALFGCFIIFTFFNYKNPGASPNPDNKSEQSLSLPKNLSGDYFYLEVDNIKTERRRYPVYDLYQLTPNNQLLKITQLGLENHYINQMILSPKHKKLIISDEDRLYTIDLVSGQKEQLNIDYKEALQNMSLSPNQKHLAIGVFSPGYNVTIYNLEDASSEIITEDEIRKFGSMPYVMPVFWINNEEVFLVRAVEGRNNYLKLNIMDNSVADSGILYGLPSPDKTKIFNSDKLPPYGGCYNPEYFDLYLQDIASAKKQVITGAQNAEFEEIAWRPDSQAVLYSKQIYTPISDGLCPSAESSEKEYYTYDLTTKKIEKIDSEDVQYAKWYPKEQLFKDLVHKGKNQSFGSLGSIE